MNNKRNTKAERTEFLEMGRNSSWIFRISGIIFFVANMITVVEMMQVNTSTYMYIINEGQVVRNIFFLFTAILYTTSFLFAIISSGTAALFGGKSNYTQSVWNTQIVAIVTLAMYAGLQIITGYDKNNQEEAETLFILVTTLVMEIFFATIAFFCLKELPNFSWRDIRPKDPNSKLCIKVYLVMLALVEIGCFIYANKLIRS